MTMQTNGGHESMTVHALTYTGDDAGIFTCSGTTDAPCHTYPDCACEVWADCDELGHERTAHDTCWMLDWVNATSPSDTYVDESGPAQVSGPVTLIWQGSFVQWTYATSTADEQISDQLRAEIRAQAIREALTEVELLPCWGVGDNRQFDEVGRREVLNAIQELLTPRVRSSPRSGRAPRAGRSTRHVR